ncbi:hypothetical protein QZH41_003388, partial [Actinostola sp. cb2023]
MGRSDPGKKEFEVAGQCCNANTTS